jgi:hypothetical protein
MGELEDIKSALIMQSCNRARLLDAAFMLADDYAEKSYNGTTKKIFASAFNAEGEKTLEVFEKVKFLYRISGSAKDCFMKYIAQIACERGIDCIASFSPIFPTVCDALYLMESNCLITTLPTAPCALFGEEKTVNCSQFCDSGLLNASKTKLKGIEKLSFELKAEAQKELAEAKRTHAAIEDIYIPAMNFSEMDEFTLKLIKSIFAE